MHKRVAGWCQALAGIVVVLAFVGMTNVNWFYFPYN